MMTVNSVQTANIVRLTFRATRLWREGCMGGVVTGYLLLVTRGAFLVGSRVPTRDQLVGSASADACLLSSGESASAEADPTLGRRLSIEKARRVTSNK